MCVKHFSLNQFKDPSNEWMLYQLIKNMLMQYILFALATRINWQNNLFWFINFIRCLILIHWLLRLKNIASILYGTYSWSLYNPIYEQFLWMFKVHMKRRYILSYCGAPFGVCICSPLYQNAIRSSTSVYILSILFVSCWH